MHNSKGKFHMKRLLLVLLATTAPVHAAEITVQRDPVLSTVLIDGVIELRDYRDFIAATRGLGKALVRLRSIGGKIIAAMQIGQEVRDRQWSTEVAGSCQSACSLIWVAGTERYLPPGSSLGFHQPKTEDGTVATDGVARIGAYLKFTGYGENTISFAVSAPPGGMRWIVSPKEAEKVGIAITHRAKVESSAPLKNP
jgi:hypothetical protein